ncbi:DNA methyltransferase [Klebsormidium nitens]|uniref:DNA (cytosine-5-)-methyltransferase n=1 Tax=Klebsormidium nitens TaxID=105231 RepID=A0A1Y1IN73_KLENI|nr:DNA methyltransferase [Klebsormidium nitens]|eukprot:GAQ89568.1 DNA methyltransferase [Klebsormidium nitens]
MESPGTQVSGEPCTTPVSQISQPMVVSQDQKRITKYFPVTKKRNRVHVQKPREGGERSSGRGLVDRPEGTPAGDALLGTALFLTEHAKELEVLPPVDMDDPWEAELLRLDLDSSFYSREGRPWKEAPKDATWHASPDLEGLDKTALETAFGKNAWGRARHSVELRRDDGGLFRVQVGEGVLLRGDSSQLKEEPETIVVVDAVLSVNESRKGSVRGDTRASAEARGEARPAEANPAVWIKGRKLLMVEETILKPPERPAGGDAAQELEWPVQERFLGIHTTALWRADRIMKKVEVLWGEQAPEPLTGAPLFCEGEGEGATRPLIATAGTSVVYVPYKYCSETHDFVALDRSPEPVLETSATPRDRQRIQGTKSAGQLEGATQIAISPTFSAPRSPAPSCPDSSSPSPAPSSKSPASPVTEFVEPLRLTYGAWPQTTPEALPPLPAPPVPKSPIILINAAALPPWRREAALRSPHLLTSAPSFALEWASDQALTPLQTQLGHAQAAVTSSSSAPLELSLRPSDSSGAPLQLPAAPSPVHPLPPQLLTAPSDTRSAQMCTPPESIYFNEPPRLPAPKPKTPPGVLRNLDLCAGTGALGLGCSYASIGGGPGAHKIVPTYAVDTEKDPLSTCVKNIPKIGVFRESMADFCDRITSRRDPNAPGPGDVEMITAGLPCQSFSGANPRNSKTSIRRNSTSSGEDPEPPVEPAEELPAGRMFFQDFLRIVEFLQPRYIIVEEVIEVLTLLDKRLHEPVGVAITRALVRLGYQTRWQILLAALFGAPQNRFRTFLCAAQIGEKLPQVAVPTHRAFGRPTKPLGLFKHCFLELPDPSAPQAAKNRKTVKGKKAPKKKPQKKKPKMGILITMKAPKTGATGADKIASVAEQPPTDENRSAMPEATELRTVRLSTSPSDGAVLDTERSSPDGGLPENASASAENRGGSGNRASGDGPGPSVPVKTGGLRGTGNGTTTGGGVGRSATEQPSGALEDAAGGDTTGGAVGALVIGQPGVGDGTGGAIGNLEFGQHSGALKKSGSSGLTGMAVGKSAFGQPGGAVENIRSSGPLGKLVGKPVLGQPSGALKRKRSEEQAPEPHPAAFFRTREGYAVVNKRPPDLTGSEGDWRTIGCSCCLQRQRAAETPDLLPAVTVYQAIGHLPKGATAERMRLPGGSFLFNHKVFHVDPGRSKRHAQWDQLGPGQKDKDLPKDLQSHGARDRGKEPTKPRGGVKGRLPRDGQSATVVCTANDTNWACVHYTYNRLASPRENALLQTFPENFKFAAAGTSDDQIESCYRQVGNAVPMVVSAALGRTILASLS